VSNVTIRENTVSLDSAQRDFGYLYQGGVAVVGGETAARANAVTGISITKNRVGTDLLGISLIGGWSAPPTSPSAPPTSSDDNDVTRAQVRCNVVPREPSLMTPDVPGIKGVNLTGGSGVLDLENDWSATGNEVECVRLKDNLVTGKLDAVSIFHNLGARATGNAVRLNRC
jgi:hypothetical protein